jgi:hypothetical protein
MLMYLMMDITIGLIPKVSQALIDQRKVKLIQLWDLPLTLQLTVIMGMTP